MFILLAGGKQIRIVPKQIRDRVQVSRPRPCPRRPPGARRPYPRRPSGAHRPPPLSSPAIPLRAGCPCPRQPPLSVPALWSLSAPAAPIHAGRPGCCQRWRGGRGEGDTEKQPRQRLRQAPLQGIHRRPPPEILPQLISIGTDLDTQFKLVLYFVS